MLCWLDAKRKHCAETFIQSFSPTGVTHFHMMPPGTAFLVLCYLMLCTLCCQPAGVIHGINRVLLPYPLNEAQAQQAVATGAPKAEPNLY